MKVRLVYATRWERVSGRREVWMTRRFFGQIDSKDVIHLEVLILVKGTRCVSSST